MIGTHLIASLLKINQTNPDALPAALSIYTQAGRTALVKNINDPTVASLGIAKPYASFNDTVERALRPFPQFQNIDTSRGNGDHSGHSTYHSMVAKVTKSYSQGLVLNASYVLSKAFSDAESTGGGSVLNQYNRRLEKGLASFDRTHEFKINYVYELPFGQGKRWLTKGILSRTVGGWHVGAVHYYAGGTPLGLGGAFGFPIIGNRPYITTYDDWLNPTVVGHGGSRFDPNVDNWLQPKSFFPVQPSDRVGNMTKSNPKFRTPWNWNENVSLAKTFQFSETWRLDLRFEGFNVLNRVRWGSPDTSLSSVNFGLVRSQANSPRNLQGGVKLYF
jgi:hypothetical protein